MATVSNWTPFGVALNITATAGTVKRISATQYTVAINVSWACSDSTNKTDYGMTATSGGGSATLNTQGTKSSGSTTKTFTGTYSISGNASATKTITVTFKNFNTWHSDEATKTVSFSVTVPAWTSYTVSYNANGGSGAPLSQTKWKDQTLTLSTTKPTRTGYTFQGWGVSASSTTVTYNPGGSYNANASITLYAVWSASYTKPRITNFSVTRCNSSGTATNTGKYARVKFNWACDKTVTSVMIDYVTNYVTVSASGTSGSVNKIIGGSFATDTSYSIIACVEDSGGITTTTKTLSASAFAIDCLPENKGVAFGKAAEIEDTAEFEYDAKFNKPVYGKALGMDTLPAITEAEDFNEYLEPGCYAVQSNSVAALVYNMPVARAGRLEVWAATGEGVRAEQWSYLKQRFVPYNRENAVWERDVTRNASNVWTFYDWFKVTLTPALSERLYEKSAITVAMTSNATLSTSGSYTKIYFNTAFAQMGSRLSLGSGGVKIGAGIDYVKVNAQLLLKAGSVSGNRHFRIQKISGSTTTSHAWTCVYAGATNNTLCNMTPIIIPVTEGDIITCVYYTSDTSDYLANGSSANGYQTYLTVETL